MGLRVGGLRFKIWRQGFRVGGYTMWGQGFTGPRAWGSRRFIVPLK